MTNEQPVALKRRRLKNYQRALQRRQRWASSKQQKQKVIFPCLVRWQRLICVHVKHTYHESCRKAYVRDDSREHHKAAVVVEHGLRSAPTQYRLYGRPFLQVKRPNQQYQSTEGKTQSSQSYWSYWGRKQQWTAENQRGTYESICEYMHLQCESKKIPPRVFWKFFPNGWYQSISHIRLPVGSP